MYQVEYEVLLLLLLDRNHFLRLCRLPVLSERIPLIVDVSPEILCDLLHSFRTIQWIFLGFDYNNNLHHLEREYLLRYPRGA